MAQFTIPERIKTKEMRYQMGYALSDLAEEYDNIVALDADLRSSTGLHIFEHFHPDKLIKCGIAEQNMIAMAAGLSQEGYITFPCTFDAFCRRFMDQLYVTVAYGNLNVKVL
ncbi:transketolase family protein, partial [Candidatus Poribacteria bacterium]|nr:transketolase family protein [Candidatus Poribacteria bacterium]